MSKNIASEECCIEKYDTPGPCCKNLTIPGARTAVQGRERSKYEELTATAGGDCQSQDTELTIPLRRQNESTRTKSYWTGLIYHWHRWIWMKGHLRCQWVFLKVTGNSKRNSWIRPLIFSLGKIKLMNMMIGKPSLVNSFPGIQLKSKKLGKSFLVNGTFNPIISRGTFRKKQDVSTVYQRKEKEKKLTTYRDGFTHWNLLYLYSRFYPISLAICQRDSVCMFGPLRLSACALRHILDFWRPCFSSAWTQAKQILNEDFRTLVIPFYSDLKSLTIMSNFPCAET